MGQRLEPQLSGAQLPQSEPRKEVDPLSSPTSPVSAGAGTGTIDCSLKELKFRKERKLLASQAGNPTFQFLHIPQLPLITEYTQDARPSQELLWDPWGKEGLASVCKSNCQRLFH